MSVKSKKVTDMFRPAVPDRAYGGFPKTAAGAEQLRLALQHRETCDLKKEYLKTARVLILAVLASFFAGPSARGEQLHREFHIRPLIAHLNTCRGDSLDGRGLSS